MVDIKGSDMTGSAAIWTKDTDYFFCNSVESNASVVLWNALSIHFVHVHKSQNIQLLYYNISLKR